MPHARLRVTDPQGRRLIPIDKSLFTIGRRTAADLQIVSTDVSREHAEIVRDGEQYVLRDRGSRYGTFVNGDLITEHTLEARRPHSPRADRGRRAGVPGVRTASTACAKPRRT